MATVDPRTLRVLPVAPHCYLGCRSGSSGFDLGSVGSVVPRRARLVLVAPRRRRSLCYLFFLSPSPRLSLSLPILLFLSPSLLYLVSLCIPVSLSISSILSANVHRKGGGSVGAGDCVLGGRAGDCGPVGLAGDCGPGSWHSSSPSSTSSSF